LDKNVFDEALVICLFLKKNFIADFYFYPKLIEKFQGYTAETESSNRYFQTTAAMIAPMTGAIINNQSWERAVPPETSAGPRLRAGFTEVPVMGMLTI